MSDQVMHTHAHTHTGKFKAAQLKGKLYIMAVPAHSKEKIYVKKIYVWCSEISCKHMFQHIYGKEHLTHLVL